MKKKIVLVFSIIVMAIFNINICYAEDYTAGLKNQLYSIGTSGKPLFDTGAYIVGYIVYVAIAISVIVLMIKAIKFITSSPEGKAEVKKELMPWSIGIIILFTMRIALNFIINFAQNNVNTL